MRPRRNIADSPAFRWTLFLLLLAAVTGWALRSVIVRAGKMSTAVTSGSAYSAMSPGTKTKAVVRIDRVSGAELKCTPLQRQSDTVYILPSNLPTNPGHAVSAILTPEAAVVMGKPIDITAGAIVQLAGTLDDHHVLRTTQVVILTGYVRLAKPSGERQ